MPEGTRIIRPTKDNILVKRQKKQDSEVGGILLPATLKKPSKLFNVIAVGNGRLDPKTGERVPLTVQKGDVVLLKGFTGTDLIIDDENYLVVKEEQIAAIESKE